MPFLTRERGRVGDAAQLGRARLALEMGVAAGVELDHRRAEPDRRLDLARVGLDEQADADVGVAQPGDESAQMVVLPGGVEPALGGPLLALLGDDAGGVRAVAQRDLEHLLGRRHLEVERDGRAAPSAGRYRSSVMWRRSSRRWAVIPSAPASAAAKAARTGSGWSPPRALRIVAT